MCLYINLSNLHHTRLLPDQSPRLKGNVYLICQRTCPSWLVLHLKDMSVLLCLGLTWKSLPCTAGPVADNEQRTRLSTLVRPFGFTKTIPLVVHSSGNAVYEEPCMAYVHVKISKVSSLAECWHKG